MPTKRELVDPPLSAAWHWALMTGTDPTARLHGWVEHALEAPAAGPALWAVHGAELATEAKAAGFKPYWLTKRTPTGKGFEQWSARFLASHTY